MIDTLCIVSSLVAVFWVAVRAAMLDPLKPWADKLISRRSAVAPGSWPAPPPS